MRECLAASIAEISFLEQFSFCHRTCRDPDLLQLFMSNVDSNQVSLKKLNNLDAELCAHDGSSRRTIKFLALTRKCIRFSIKKPLIRGNILVLLIISSVAGNHWKEKKSGLPKLTMTRPSRRYQGSGARVERKAMPRARARQASQTAWLHDKRHRPPGCR